jgi:hypothetical protein
MVARPISLQLVDLRMEHQVNRFMGCDYLDNVTSPFAVQKVQKLNSWGAALWLDSPLSPWRTVAMLSPT